MLWEYRTLYGEKRINMVRVIFTTLSIIGVYNEPFSCLCSDTLKIMKLPGGNYGNANDRITGVLLPKIDFLSNPKTNVD